MFGIYLSSETIEHSRKKEKLIEILRVSEWRTIFSERWPEPEPGRRHGARDRRELWTSERSWELQYPVSVSVWVRPNQKTPGGGKRLCSWAICNLLMWRNIFTLCCSVLLRNSILAGKDDDWWRCLNLLQDSSTKR